LASTNDPIGSSPDIVLRVAGEWDAPRLARLAALDSQRLPAGPLLVAELEGEIWAAMALHGDAVIANPFRPTAALLELLAGRRRQLRSAGTPRHAPARRRLAWLGARDARIR
jgi:hypothetical protein